MELTKLLQIESYIEGLFAQEDPILLDVKATMKEAGLPAHNIFPNQSILLQILLRLGGACRVLEIGTLGGYSTICLARALPQDGRVYTIEIEEKYADIAQNNFLKADLGDKIQILRGEALEVLRQLEEEGIEPFDFVFLDAHKPSYVEYFDWAVEHTAPGALIVADNVIRDGAVLSPETTDEKAQGVIAYNDMLARRSDVQTILVPNISGNGYDGMALSVKR